MTPRDALSPSLAAARAGDPAAQEWVVHAVRSIAQHICKLRLPPGGGDLDWEDVSQEACRRLFAGAMDRFKGTAADRSYVYAVVHRTALEILRKSNRRTAREQRVVLEARSAPAGGGIAKQIARIDVDKILSKLGGACGDLLRSVFLEDVPYAELASRLGLAESSVRAKVSRCLRSARKLIEASP